MDFQRLKDKENISKNWQRVEIGKRWVKDGEFKRFYFSEDVISFFSSRLSVTTGLHGLYVDMNSLELVADQYHFPEVDQNGFHALLDKLLNLLKDNIHKECFSTWTGQEQICEDVYHFLGRVRTDMYWDDCADKYEKLDIDSKVLEDRAEERRAKLEERELKAQEAAAKKAEEHRGVVEFLGGEPLTGTGKQMKWGEEIRSTILKEIKDETLVRYLLSLAKFKKAKFWIENRGLGANGLHNEYYEASEKWGKRNKK